MASNLERLEQLRSQLLRFKNDYVTQARILGTEKDNEAHRKKLARLKQRYTDTDNKASALLSEAPSAGPDVADWQQLRSAIKGLRADFDAADRDVKARETAKPLQGAPAGSSADHREDGPAAGGAPRGGHTGVRMQEFRQVDDAELLTEEALQTEKLEGILDVERDMNELRGMYHELHGHVTDQQVGLNTAEGNIDKAQTHVEKGVTELKSANKLQKSSRKKMFILLAIIAIIVVIVIVVIVVVKGG